MIFENSLIVSIRKAKHKRLFVLQEPLLCFDDTGRRWEIPKGFATDFASIPAVGRAFIDKAHQNAYAAVLHDYLYYTQPVNRVEADALFYEALASPDCNTPEFTRWIMYRAVRFGGGSAWDFWHQTPETENSLMTDQNVIEEEKGFFAKFIDWVRRTRRHVDEELDELDDEVRTRVKKRFRAANWPGVREREILFQNKVKKSVAFKIAYMLVFISSLITLYYWWGAMPDFTSKLLIGSVFFFANLLMPLWARMTFWQGGTWLQPVVNCAGLMIFIVVAGASIMASAGLQGTQTDYRQSERAQQKIQYETKLAEAEALKKRIAELRDKTTRAPNEIKSELDGLLITEPKPQSGCQSSDNFGRWSKRNCPHVTRLRTEHSQARERVRLEQEASELTFDDVPKVNSVDPQYDIVKRYTSVDRKTFNETKPIILAFIAELVFDGLTILLTIVFGAEVREELRNRVNKQRRDIIVEEEQKADDEKKHTSGINDKNGDGDGGESDPVVAEPDPGPKPLSPAPVSENSKLPDGIVVLPETKTERITETTREIKSSTLANANTTPFLDATEPEPQQIEKVETVERESIVEPAIMPSNVIVEKQDAPSVPVMVEPEIVDAPVSQHTITEKYDPVLVDKIKELESKIAESEAAKSVEDGDKDQLKAENLTLKFEKLAASRAVRAEVQQLAKYAIERFAYRVGSNINLNFALKDYEAWCTKKGLSFGKPINEFHSIIETDLGLIVQDTDEGAMIIVNTEIRS